MILISHRGNVTGQNPSRENTPSYIDEALALGYDVEIDVWMVGDGFYLGHDEPLHKVDIAWIDARAHRLWVHCKNTQAIAFFNKFDYDINYFWHENDTVTLTSKNYIWAYPGKQPIQQSIAVLPEAYNESCVDCLGICSDIINKYK